MSAHHYKPIIGCASSAVCLAGCSRVPAAARRPPNKDFFYLIYPPSGRRRATLQETNRHPEHKPFHPPPPSTHPPAGGGGELRTERATKNVRYRPHSLSLILCWSIAMLRKATEAELLLTKQYSITPPLLAAVSFRNEYRAYIMLSSQPSAWLRNIT